MIGNPRHTTDNAQFGAGVLKRLESPALKPAFPRPSFASLLCCVRFQTHILSARPTFVDTCNCDDDSWRVISSQAILIGKSLLSLVL